MRRIILISAMLVWASASAAEYDAGAYWAGYRTCTTRAEAIDLCRTFADNAEKIEVLKLSADEWRSLDEEGALEYFLARHEADPSAESAYLLAQVKADYAERLSLAREVIDAKPSWSWGYRLLGEIYREGLFEADEPDAFLATALEGDEALFAQASKREGRSVENLKDLYLIAIHRGNLEYAEALMDEAAADRGRWTRPSERAVLMVHMGRLGEAEKLVAGIVQEYVDQGQVPENERGDAESYFLDNALRRAKSYELMLQHALSQAKTDDGPAPLFDAACALALMGRNDEAFARLDQALAAGYTDYNHASEDGDLSVLHDDVRWTGWLGRLESTWLEKAPERRAAIQEGKVDEPAPDWTLSDPDGDTVSLADLRGQVVILDFWATWCGPCRMAMPVLDRWMKEDMPAGVSVFSINVWEQTKLKPRLFIEDHDYAMTLLYGDNDLTKAYGVTGIPVICAIDTEGRIRYREVGYSSELAEKLQVWVDDLLP